MRFNAMRVFNVCVIKKRFVLLPALYTETSNCWFFFLSQLYWLGTALVREGWWCRTKSILLLANGKILPNISQEKYIKLLMNGRCEKENRVEIRKSDLLLHSIWFELIPGIGHTHTHFKVNKATKLHSNFTIYAVICWVSLCWLWLLWVVHILL